MAGSTPILASPNGSAVPVKTDVITMANSESEMAVEFRRLPLVR